MKLTKQSTLIPPELWLAARVIERHAVGEDDDAVCNGEAALYLLDSDHLEELVAKGYADIADPLVRMAVELIRDRTTRDNPLLAPLPALPETGAPDPELVAGDS